MGERTRNENANENANPSSNTNESNDDNYDRINTTAEQWRTETKIVLHQSLGYLAAFVLCQVFPLISLLNVIRQRVTIFQYLHITLRPLQGLFNFLIFVGHKVHNQRRADPSLTRLSAVKKLFVSGREEPEPTLFLGNMTMVIRRGNGDGGEDDLLDISFSEVRETSERDYALSGRENGAVLSRGMVSFDPSTTMRETKSVDKVEHYSQASGLSYGESITHHLDAGKHGDEDGDLEVIEEVGFVDDDSGLEIASRSYRGGENASNSNAASVSGIMSWFSRITPGSREISCAVSSIGS